MEWIKINKEDLSTYPSNGEWVITCANGFVSHYFALWCNNRWTLSERSATPEYWMKRPEPPKQPQPTWQYAFKQSPDEWRDATAQEHEVGQHLSKYLWREVTK